MKINGLKKILFFTSFLFLMVVLSAEAAEDFEKGKITRKVVCKADEGQSYALYLPAAYTKEKKWPVLFAFDPAARGTLPLKLFKAAADKYNYIIVCSNNARNGPWQDIINAMKAVWRDTKERFSIDYNRIYTTGFSGGARGAAAFPHVIGKPIAGIIASGAGLPTELKAEQVKPSFYYGIVGLEDFNYKEFSRLGRELTRAGVDHVIDVIEGPHTWAPEEVCLRAIDWMEAAAMKRGLIERDKNFIDGVYKNSQRVGQKKFAAGKIYHAAAYYRSAAALFTGLTDTAEIEKLAAQIESSKEFKNFSREEKTRNDKELAFISRFAFVFSLVRNTDPAKIKLKKVLADLQLDFLSKEVNREENVYDRAMAKRLLPELRMKGNQEGTKYLEKGELERAYFFFEIAARADSRDPIAFYNLACYYSLKNKKKEALKKLRLFAELALKQGYRNFSFVEKDEHLKAIRKEKEFREILEFLKQKR